jgi:hypothetical protein
MSRGSEGRRLRTDNEPAGLRAMARAVRCAPRNLLPTRAVAESGSRRQGCPAQPKQVVFHQKIRPEIWSRNGFKRIIVRTPARAIVELIELADPHEDVIVTRHERRTSVASALPCHVPATGALALTGDSRGAHT